MDRRKLDSVVEKEAYTLVSNVKNHAESFLHLYTRRNKIKVDDDLLNRLVEIFGMAVEEGFQTQVDIFNKSVGKALDQYVVEDGEPSLKRKK